MSSHATLDLQKGQDVLPIECIDYLELYSGNAKQTAFYLCKLFGFDIIAYSGLETGNRERASYVLAQGDIRLVISCAYKSDHQIAQFVHKKGDSVRDIAFRVKDLEATYAKLIERGATSVQAPTEEHDEHGVYKKATVAAFGDTVHTLIEREAYQGIFAPGYVEQFEKGSDTNTGIVAYDHLAVFVEDNDEWVAFYDKVFGFQLMSSFSKDDISTERSSLMTKVSQNNNSRIKLPINSPAEGKGRSQISEFIEYNEGPGIGHIAFLTHDIMASIEHMQNNGLRFLYTPQSYYDLLPERVGEIDEPFDKLNELNVLVDRDDEGYLLQIFCHPVHDRPTLYFELIQRKGSRGFGDGNIRALYEAMEREQAKRGNL
ncbi:4-hydroxyphenylpyruvate dioxygenase [Tumebacillus sp. BK434]|uniref:4-hydroxyphenylpyruvate dioxygenase n=1 Tax=Tumebacillus sp. BK434 TaxID=2512169 RepID=UPI00105287EA|nr:4-hydroxyphenylpyruvate dioxygenase [Tumebacillus sp. BK434]TCP57965.1 4-hydroxyphenylpyruvate dioxygenase [Tumebacillus sp. BK434]